MIRSLDRKHSKEKSVMSIGGSIDREKKQPSNKSRKNSSLCGWLKTRLQNQYVFRPFVFVTLSGKKVQTAAFYSPKNEKQFSDITTWRINEGRVYVCIVHQWNSLKFLWATNDWNEKWDSQQTLTAFSRIPFLINLYDKTGLPKQVSLLQVTTVRADYNGILHLKTTF